jgi:hypothetical protein
LLSLILLSGVTAVASYRRSFLVCGTVAAVAVIARWSSWISSTPRTTEINDSIVLFSLGVLCIAIGIRVFGAGRVTLDRVLGAVALYTLIGVVWAEAYQLVSVHSRGSFTGLQLPDPFDRSTWIYFSFVTLTTVGYGDIAPVAHVAKSLAIFEALIGQLYPAIVLARLVSLHSAGSLTDKKT